MTALYRVFLSMIVTRGRIAGLVALGALAIVVGFAIGADAASDKINDGTLMISSLGLSLIAPVVTLVLASAVLGDANEDGTLVYLWLRPVARWRIAVAALAAALTVSLPLVVLPLTIAAAATKAGGVLVQATAASCALAVVAYAAIFTFLGLRVKRAMAWGLGYILVWEGFVARAGKGARFFSVHSHAATVLSRISGGPERLVHQAMPTAVAVPLVAAVLALLATVRRLRTQDVA